MDAPRSRGYRRTAQILSHGLEQAQRWVGAGIEGGGLDRQDLKALPRSDAKKVALAKFLRERTTVSLEWVARALYNGRGGETRALRANTAMEECEEESPEGNVAVHRAASQ
jgi:hypothetical protein